MGIFRKFTWYTNLNKLTGYGTCNPLGLIDLVNINVRAKFYQNIPNSWSNAESRSAMWQVRKALMTWDMYYCIMFDQQISKCVSKKKIKNARQRPNQTKMPNTWHLKRATPILKIICFVCICMNVRVIQCHNFYHSVLSIFWPRMQDQLCTNSWTQLHTYLKMKYEMQLEQVSLWAMWK